MKKLVLLLIFSLIMSSVNIYADDCGWSFEADGWTITNEGIIEGLELNSAKENETVEITDYIKYQEAKVIIPSKIGTIDVCGLGHNWTGILDGIEIYIPNSITYISDIETYSDKNNLYCFEKGSYAEQFFKDSGLRTKYVDSVKNINLEDSTNRLENLIQDYEKNKSIYDEKFETVELDIKNEFKNIIQKYNSGRYFLYDANGEGIPELFIYNIDEYGNILTDNAEMIKKDENNKEYLFLREINYYGNRIKEDGSKEGAIISLSMFGNRGYMYNGKEYDEFKGGNYSFYTINCNGTENLILFSADSEHNSKTENEGDYSVLNKNNSVYLFSNDYNDYQNSINYISISQSLIDKFIDGKRIYVNLAGKYNENIDVFKKLESEIKKNPVTTYSVKDMTGLNNWDFSNLKINKLNQKQESISDEMTTSDITVILNEQKLAFSQPPVIENGTTLVPMRAIFEAMGASVEWNGETKSITAVKDDTTINLTLNETMAKVNNNEITLAVPAKLINGNTMVPLRFISESLGAEVNWDGESRTVTINE